MCFLCYIGTVVTCLLKVVILKVYGIAIVHVFATKHLMIRFLKFSMVNGVLSIRYFAV